MDNNTQTNNGTGDNTQDDNNQNATETNTSASNNNEQNKGDDNSNKVDDKSTKQDTGNSAKEEENERISKLESELACFKKGVAEENVNDVIALAKSYINDKTDINKAIDIVLKKYPSFINLQNNGSFDTGVKSKGDNTTLNGVEKEFYKRNPNLKK